MYRVAVIQNESESLRSGYANVSLTLSHISQLDGYHFVTFDSHNIDTLFAGGDNTISTFDSIFVSTNATSDPRTLRCLSDHADEVEAFIDGGGGMFVSYQKELNSSRDHPAYIPFLGDQYKVACVERPPVEKDSGQGTIDYNVARDAFESAAGQVLLNHPNSVSKEDISRHCRENDFKQHFYRSHLLFASSSRYEPLLVDRSYTGSDTRVLLAANRVSFSGERVVVSTIALDWQLNISLLTNITVYITEGIPGVAFVDAGNPRNGDFEYLLASARLAKIPHSVYGNLSGIPTYLKHVHRIYVLSPGWTDAQRATFWNEVANTGGPIEGPVHRPYRRLYQIDPEGADMALFQWSSFSSVDLLVDRVVFGIESKYRGGFWEGSFWNTHDALPMMIDMGVDISRYLPGVFSDLAKHTRNEGYDGVIGATCALLTLLSKIRDTYPDLLQESAFNQSKIAEMVEWVAGSWHSQTHSGKQVAALVLLGDTNHREILQSSSTHMVENMLRDLRASLPTLASDLHGLNAVELCRLLECYLLVEANDEAFIQAVRQLASLQDPSGAWETTGWTGAVLVTLLQNWDDIQCHLRGMVDLDALTYSGILHLRSQYNAQTSDWAGHFQTTVRSIHAIGLYNRKFKHSTQEFFEVIQANLNRMEPAVSVGSSRIEFSDLVQTNTALRNDGVSLQQKIEALEHEREQQDRSVDALYGRLKWTQPGLAFAGTLLVGLIVSLLLDHADVVEDMVSDVGSTLSITVAASLIVSILVGKWATPARPG